jgi:Zn-dependent protease with chaperone function
MLLPFIPFILALAGLSVIGALPGPERPLVEGWELAAVYASMLVIGALVGNIGEYRLGPRSPMRLSRRRVLQLGLWLLIAATAPVFQSFGAIFSGFRAGEELALAVMLANFWVSDALALRPYNPFFARFLPAQGRQLARDLGFSMPIMILVALGAAFGLVSEAVPGLNDPEGLLPPWLNTFGGIALYLAVAGVMIPALIPFCWRLQALPAGPAERAIREELAANGVAGVIGIVPRFRYLLFSDALSHALTPAEIRSVTAHEAAHIRHRHLWFFFAAILGFILLMHILLQGVLVGGLWIGHTLPFWSTIIIEVSALLVFLRFGIGFLSRNFERQADGNALRRGGLPDFQSAILKIGRINGIPTEADNWHHYGIGRRLAYLREAEQAPEFLTRHDRMVRRIKVACLAGLAVCLVAQTVFSGTGIVSYLVEERWLSRLEYARDLTPAELDGLSYLAMQAYVRGDFATAERYFRRLLASRPDDAEMQNNLAWLLVTGPRADRARLAEGLQLAQRAAGSGEQAFIWDTLAEAYLRLNRLSESESAAERALRLAEAGKGRGDTPLSYYRTRLEQISGIGREPGRR